MVAHVTDASVFRATLTEIRNSHFEYKTFLFIFSPYFDMSLLCFRLFYFMTAAVQDRNYTNHRLQVTEYITILCF
jgi:hypothetical protein